MASPPDSPADKKKDSRYVLDHVKAPLHACSMESLPTPVSITQNGSKEFWPLALSCYQLKEDGTRQGNLSVFLVPVPEFDWKQPDQDGKLSFGPPYPIHQHPHKGILDGKWFSKQEEEKQDWYFATALSTGQVSIDRFQFNGQEPEEEEQKRPFQVEQVAMSDPPEETNALCLSLHWDNPSTVDTPENNTSSIVSSHSNGIIRIHDVAFLEHSVQLIEREAWLAHTGMFGDIPSEVWTTCFLQDSVEENKMVLSGGDDCKLKLWDVRSTTRPMQIFETFGAGVTTVAPHPRKEHLVACGSYDETVALYDIRYAAQKPLARSPPLGGGIWRIQWHPCIENRILLAAMHGGCRVVELNNIETKINEEEQFHVVQEFRQHESMAYGAAWLVCPHPTQDEYYEAAASCSFYDSAAYLWNAHDRRASV